MTKFFCRHSCWRNWQFSSLFSLVFIFSLPHSSTSPPANVSHLPPSNSSSTSSPYFPFNSLSTTFLFLILYIISMIIILHLKYVIFFFCVLLSNLPYHSRRLATSVLKLLRRPRCCLPVELLYELVQSTQLEQCAQLAFATNCAPLAVLADRRHKKLALLRLALMERTREKRSPMENAPIKFFESTSHYPLPRVIGHYNYLTHREGRLKFIAPGNFEAKGGDAITQRLLVKCPLAFVTVSAHSIAFWQSNRICDMWALSMLPVERELRFKYDKHSGEIRWTRSGGCFGRNGWVEQAQKSRSIWTEYCLWVGGPFWTQVRFRPLLSTDFDALLAVLQKRAQSTMPHSHSHCGRRGSFSEELPLANWNMEEIS